MSELSFGKCVIHAPSPRDATEAWRDLLDAWRTATLRGIDCQERLREHPDFAWTRSVFTCSMLMAWDAEFYDPAAAVFDVEKYLQRGVEQFGGYDAVILWHSYPRIGVDERNQFDFYRQFPGGLRGVRRIADRLHAHGARVFVVYHPWDTGTRREPTVDADALADLVSAVDADGVFLDTIDQGTELRSALDRVKPGVVFLPENEVSLESLHDHQLSWGHRLDLGSPAPAVLRNKWLDRGHMYYLVDRWARDNTDELHTAWMNGVGVMVWENVFGTWNGWSEADSSLLRAMAPIQRRYADLFAEGDWTPLVPTLDEQVYASRWERDGLRIWTVVNRSDVAVDGPLLELDDASDLLYGELVSGRALQPLAGRLAVDLPARGIAGVVAASGRTWQRRVAATLDAPAQRQRSTATDQSQSVVGRVKVATTPAVRSVPPGMHALGPVTRDLDVIFRLRECGTYRPPPVFDPENPRFRYATQRFRAPHMVQESHHITLGGYAIDTAPVTNAEYAAFLGETGYRPSVADGFLAHWAGETPTPGTEHLPVVHIDLDDARSYARWAGKRLPTEHEWQHAIEDGTVGYSQARIWEWTESVHSDHHTRFCVLKGGADYAAHGPPWYFDGGPRPPQFAAKLVLSWPALDRFSTVGFRCAVDMMPKGRR